LGTGNILFHSGFPESLPSSQADALAISIIRHVACNIVIVSQIITSKTEESIITSPKKPPEILSPTEAALITQ
jgi:hypothetical protein